MSLQVILFNGKEICSPENSKVLRKSFFWLCLITTIILAATIKAVPQNRATDGSTPSGLETGTPSGSYSLSGFENVNLFNGNLNFSLPLLKIGGRGDAQSGINLAIDSAHWSVKKSPGTRVFEETYDPYNTPNHPPIVGGGGTGSPTTWGVVPELRSSFYETSYGPGFMTGKVTGSAPKETQMLITFTASDGTEYQLRDLAHNGQSYPQNASNRNRGNVFIDADGSGLTFVSDTMLNDNDAASNENRLNLSGRLLFGNGTRYDIANNLVTKIRDRNGNEIHYDYDYTYGFAPVKTITDSLGRTINITHTIVTQTGYDQISFKGVGGAARAIKIWHGTLQNVLRQTQPTDSGTTKTYGQLFPAIYNDSNYSDDGRAETVYNPNVVTKVELPDGRTYRFFYNVYGELSRIELPTGGAVEYDYTPNSGVYSNYNFQILRRVVKRRQYDDGATLTSYQTYEPTSTPIYNGGSVPYEWTTDTVVEQRDAANNLLSKSKHTFWGNPANTLFKSPFAYPGFMEGRETQTVAYAADGTTPLRQTNNDWQQCTGDCDLSVAWWQQPSGVSPGYAPANSPRLAQTTETLSDTNQITKTTFNYDRYNNLTDKYEYDFGSGQAGGLLRRTHIDYITDTNYTGYTTAHLISLPSQSWVSSDAEGSNKAVLTAYEYDNYTADGNHAALLPRNNVTNFDSANFSSIYTRRGNVTATTSYADAQTLSQPISVYSKYDVLGNVVETIDGKGNHSTIGYSDNFGSPSGEARAAARPDELNQTQQFPQGANTFALPTSATNPMNWITGYSQFDYYTGQPVDVEDINGIVNSIFYNDPLDRPTQMIAANNLTAFKRQTNIVYDDAGHRVETKSDLNAFNDNLLKSESFYDKMGRTVKTKKYESDGGFVLTEAIPFAIVQDAETGSWRAAAKVSNPYRPNAGEQAVWTTSLSDEIGRAIKTITPDGAIAKTEYGGNAVTVTDQAGKQRRSLMNASGQLTRVDEPDGSGNPGSVGAPNQPTFYGYDALSNLTSVKQGGTLANPTQTRTFVYDSLSRLKQATNPESGVISYTYDNNGNLQTRRDARGIKTIYDYDALNRVVKRCYRSIGTGSLGATNCSDATSEPPEANTSSVTYTYDNLPNAKGRLTKVENGLSKTEYQAFDILGRVTQSQQTTDGAAYGDPMTYTYNFSGALIEEKYPSGRVVRNVLDNDGDLSIVQSRKNANSGFWNYADNFTYTAAGAVSSMQLGNGRWESTQFNSRLQPVQIALGTVRNATDKLKLDFEYGTVNGGTGQIITGTNNGNIGKQTITAPTETRGGTTYSGFSATQYYAYDSLNRLQSAAENLTPNGQAAYQTWRQTFTYDRFGNRNFDEANTTTVPKNCGGAVCAADVPVVNPSVNTATNRLNGYTYDNAGNTTRDAQSRKFTYDGENHQTKVEAVDANGNPVSTIGEYFYDGDGRRVKKIAGTEVTIFIYDAAGKLVAEYANQIAQSQDAKVSYVTGDHLGSPRINTDANGAVTARHDYQPFGEEIARTNYGADTVRQKFTGKELDGETGFDCFEARFYISVFGKFTTPDPFLPSAETANPQTWNRYTYVLNNPLKYVDPLGLSYSDLDKAQLRVFQTYVNKYNKDHNTSLSAEDVYKTLDESQQATFEANTYALEHTELHDKKGNSLGNALSLVKSVNEILGDNVGGDHHMRLYVTLTDNAVETLSKSKEFKSSSDFFGLHGGYDKSYRQKGDLPSIQFSYMSKDKTQGDIDIDYRGLGEGHTNHYNSDIRQVGSEKDNGRPINNYLRYSHRWSGLRQWWQPQTHTNKYYEGKAKN